ncbi:prepilin peptidase [Rhodobacteraceae bacterium]|nr:prepilin peptidase [Paracoccaceae bacterium]
MPPWTDLFIVTAAVLVAMAPMTASFLQCWADRARLDAGVGLPAGRSACDGCGTTLGPIDLVPVFGWLLNRGKARCCGADLHPKFLYGEALVLFCAIWAVLLLPWPVVLPTLLLIPGLQGIVLLTGPKPKIARGFAGALTVLGLLVAWLLLQDQLLNHAGATLLGLALWMMARLQRAVAPDALFLLPVAGAFLGFDGLAITCFVAIPGALAYQVLKPFLYPEHLRRPVMPGEAVVFGLAAAIWIVWLYFTF